MVKNLKKLREEHGLSQQQLAEMLGITQQAVYKYERTSVEPDISTLIKMAEILHTDVDYLIGRKAASDIVSLNLSDDEEQMIRQFRKQPSEIRKSISELIANLK